MNLVTNDEKESLLECAFMVRVVFGGIEYHRYMDITDRKFFFNQRFYYF